MTRATPTTARAATWSSLEDDAEDQRHDRDEVGDERRAGGADPADQRAHQQVGDARCRRRRARRRRAAAPAPRASRAGSPGRTAASRSWRGRACAPSPRGTRSGPGGAPPGSWPGRSRGWRAARGPRRAPATSPRCRLGRLISTTPTSPTPSPRSCGPVVRRPKNSSPKMAVNIGTAPLRSPVTAELMCCSASGNSVKGMPTQMIDRATMCDAVLGTQAQPRAREEREGDGAQPDAQQGDDPGLEALQADGDEEERRAPDQPDRGEDRPVLRGERRRGGAPPAWRRAARSSPPHLYTVAAPMPRRLTRRGRGARAAAAVTVAAVRVGDRPCAERSWSHASNDSASSSASTVSRPAVASSSANTRSTSARTQPRARASVSWTAADSGAVRSAARRTGAIDS